ncbi:TetR/AcrR family transcriptional regulator [Nibrella saemangeumensis]|uniref:TetR/AcrR family transcriptional regulator n=1 Tax=Nibrella saemangeumensis TaxID=1084526 RepID=A0ABP8MAP6_9BACT
MTTKEKILETARLLFNENGVETVTVRSLAQEVGISHGNLCYHFANTDVIIERLYLQLAETISTGINQLVPGESLSLELLRRLGTGTFALLYEYRFLMRDFAGIMRRLPAIREQHQALMQRRRDTFRLILHQLRKQDILRSELYPGQDSHLIEQMLIVGDFWLSSADVLYEGPDEAKINHYVSVFEALLLPMLTEKGLQQWFAIPHSNPDRETVRGV